MVRCACWELRARGLGKKNNSGRRRRDLALSKRSGGLTFARVSWLCAVSGFTPSWYFPEVATNTSSAELVAQDRSLELRLSPARQRSLRSP